MKALDIRIKKEGEIMLKLGSVDEFKSKVNEVTIKNEKYYLIKEEDTFKLLSRKCPHQGTYVTYCDNKFVCPAHGWKFGLEGNCENVVNKQLTNFKVLEHNGELFVSIDNKEHIQTHKRFKADPTFKLYSHASLEIEYNGFNLLCDPWLDGPAFMGAWLQYPPSSISAEHLNPDAIWISHEHSDHFHEPTLKKINKLTPVYIPAFPNKRMEDKLRNLGFLNVISMPFGVPIKLKEDITITVYEPASLWNDAMVLFEIGDMRFLNLNDAGINHDLASKIGPVHIIATSFSPGASGYPLTWSNMDDERKVDILKNGKTGILIMLEQAMKIYGAQYLLPFASHFVLWHESHENYKTKLVQNKNNVQDVVDYFVNTDVNVVDILPGGVWYPLRNKIDNISIPSVEEAIMKARKETDFSRVHPDMNSILSKVELEHYFLNLNNIPEMIFCEDLTCLINIKKNDEVKFKLSFEINKGKLKIIDKVEMPNITMTIPENIMKFIVENNESWDEATIGYWCEFSRNPDIYHADFWRILQAPYYKKNPQIMGFDNVSIAELLEQKGEQAERVLSRYGMHCIGCSGSISETIQQGARAHGIEENKIVRLIQELNRI